MEFPVKEKECRFWGGLVLVRIREGIILSERNGKREHEEHQLELIGGFLGSCGNLME